jgi:hypothetical protein
VKERRVKEQEERIRGERRREKKGSKEGEGRKRRR